MGLKGNVTPCAWHDCTNSPLARTFQDFQKEVNLRRCRSISRILCSTIGALIAPKPRSRLCAGRRTLVQCALPPPELEQPSSIVLVAANLSPLDLLISAKRKYEADDVLTDS